VQNLTGVKTIAYSGENDKQKQAADRVVQRARRLGIEFPYVIGNEMGHKIDAASKQTISRQLDRWAEQVDPGPTRGINFVTYTLRYHNADWLRVTGMEQHWTPAVVKATLDPDSRSLELVTDGVTRLEVDFSDTGWPDGRDPVGVDIDGQKTRVRDTGNVAGLQCRLVRDASGRWTQQITTDVSLRKRPGLQGPIDDAFCDRFVIVLPSRPARHGQVQRWIDRETEYFRRRWSRLMRGEVRVVLDRDVTDTAAVKPCYVSLPDELLTTYPVSKRVGNVRNNDPSLVEKAPQQKGLFE